MQFQLCIMHKSNSFLCALQHKEFKISFPLFIMESFSSSAREKNRRIESFYFRFSGFYMRNLEGKIFFSQLSKTGCLAFENVRWICINLYCACFASPPSRWHNKFHVHLEEISPTKFSLSRWHVVVLPSLLLGFLIKKCAVVKCAKAKRKQQQKIS